MSGLVFTNFAKSKIASAPDGTTGTSFSVTAGDGALFPNPGTGEYFYGVFKDSDGNHEVVKVTARSTDSLTITRAQDNSTAQTWSVGDYFLLGPTAAMMKDLLTEAQTYTDNAIIPSGTRMLFQQTSAPTGWTKETDTTYNNIALRLTTGTASTGGGPGNGFTSIFSSSQATKTHALTEAELPSITPTITISDSGHAHTITDPGHFHSVTNGVVGGSNGSWSTGGSTAWQTSGINTGTKVTGITINSHTTGITATSSSFGSGTAHSHDIDLSVLYADVIIASKDA